MDPMDARTALLQRLRSREALIAVVGLGYVGLPLSLTLVESGFRVLGLDIDPDKVKALQMGRSYIEHIDVQRVASAWSAGRLEASLDFQRATEADALILCVPTPLGPHREPDLGFIRGALEALLPHLRPGQLISLESTTYPGTTEEELRPRIEAHGLRVGVDVFLVYSPEREDPGNTRFSTATIPKVIGGSTAACLEIGVALYEQAIRTVVPVSNTSTAEFTKLLENIHRAVNIGLMNELKPLADRMHIDLYEVIKAAAIKPFGFVPYYPGPGLGGALCAD
jgi:UDP-N-acetyl-D-glucosamine dehydrogenase